MKNIEEFLKDIASPPEELTPIPFWFFNDAPDEEKIAAQLSDFVEKGITGIVLHPRIGIPEDIPYLSEKYFDVVEKIIKIADCLRIKVVLYDEGMYPSGSAHGKVVEINPAYAARGIALVEEPGENEILASLQDGRYLIYCFTGGTIRGIHFGEDDGEKGAPLAADILNPKAVQAFIQLTHENYYRRLKEYFGTTIIGFFTDEPCALGRYPHVLHARTHAERNYPPKEWAEGMEKEILEHGGRMEDLEGLFTGRENYTTLLYHKLVKKHLRETFYKPLSVWCQEHGIWLMGHPEASDDVEEQLYFQIPGQDLIMRRVIPKKGGLREPDSVQAKLSADIARHLGRRRNASECFGVCGRNGIPWYFTGEDMKWYIDWLGIRGTNLYIPHAFYYSISGQRKDERPPDVGPHNIWWPYYQRFADYMKRMCFLMTDSVNCAKVAVLCDNNRVPYQEVAALYERQIEFNYLPVSLLKDCIVSEKKLQIHGYTYTTVLNLLGQETGQELPESLKVYSVEELLKQEAQREIRTIKTEKDAKNLRVSHLLKEERSIYLLSNEGNEEIHTCISLPETGKLLQIDLWEGGLKAAEDYQAGCRRELWLQSCETLLIIIDKAGKMQDKTFSENFLGNWTDRFTLLEEGDNRISYEYRYQTDKLSGNETFLVEGEEMIECFCNGKLSGVSFWNPHKFSIGSFLKKGENRIIVRITGNAANQYDDKAEIFYGLKQKPVFANQEE